MAAASSVSRIRRTVASAVTGCRGLSAFSAEELKTLKESLEMRLGVKMQRHFETRVQGIVRSEVTKEIVASEAAMINREMNIPALMTNAKDKQELNFRAKLAEQELWFTMKINAADRTMTKTSRDLMTSYNSYSNECDKRDHDITLKSKLAEGRHELFQENLSISFFPGLNNLDGYMVVHFVEHTRTWMRTRDCCAVDQRKQYNLMKVVGGGVSVAAIGTLCYYLFH